MSSGTQVFPKSTFWRHHCHCTRLFLTRTQLPGQELRLWRWLGRHCVCMHVCAYVCICEGVCVFVFVLRHTHTHIDSRLRYGCMYALTHIQMNLPYTAPYTAEVHNLKLVLLLERSESAKEGERGRERERERDRPQQEDDAYLHVCDTCTHIRKHTVTYFTFFFSVLQVHETFPKCTCMHAYI